MLGAIIALVLVLAIAAPHVAPLHAVAPRTASAVWFFALALRALVAIGTAIFVFVYVPQTEVFGAAADWCWAIVSHHLGLSAHPLAHAATVLPALAITASLLWVLFGLVRAAVALRVLLVQRSLGEGPMGSVVVEEDDVFVAVTGVGRARIVVSRTALGAMDREELAASVAHELGHIRRRHRPLLLLGSAFTGLGRLLPGSRAAERELRFSLERDADEYAVRKTRDPLALASAICKASGAQAPASATVGLGGRGRVTLRLEYLVGSGPRRGAVLERSMRLLAAFLAAITLVLAAAVPAWAVANPGGEPGAVPGHGCPEH